MPDERSERIESLFHKAKGLPAEEREAYLRRACEGDEDLLRAVGSLLGAQDAMTTGFRSPAEGVGDAVASAGGVRARPRIGPYELLSVLGEGGFGVVYLAERREPHTQRVALKVIKPGMDTKGVIARFEQERQALAVMDHPNVAKVYDAGVTDEGRPYFVMEHVKGEPITAYCDRHNLSIRRRLELFIPVCEAVQHAHMKGIIHRDIKPSNVLVEVVDEKPVPKVIDFGVAKAVSRTLTEKTVFTEQGQLIGTPEYMSPEQAEMGATDVDTRTDVYSLGVLLYELLTGVLPFDPKSLREAGFDEIRRIIREVDPPRPSTRLSSLGDSAQDAARHRAARVDDLARELGRELEWIPLKAMRKDRTHRYRTPSDLADDMRNYLAGNPLEAGPESAAYRARKFLRKHRGPAAAVAAVVVALTAGLVGVVLALGEAERQRAVALEREADAQAQRAIATEKEAEARQRADELEELAAFQESQLSEIDTALMGLRLREGVLSQSRLLLERRGLDEEAVEAGVRDLEHALAGVNFTNIALASLEEYVLGRALVAIDRGFADQPLVRARLLQTVAATMRRLGLLDKATAPQIEALDIRRELLGEKHPSTLTSINEMGSLLQVLGRDTDAEAYFREALEARRRVLGDEHPETLTSIRNMGLALHRQGRYIEAEPYVREAMEVGRRVLGDEHPNTLISINNMGALLRDQGRVIDAEVYYREVLEGRRRVLGDDHPATLNSINEIGVLLRGQNRLSDAEPYYREVLEGRRRVLGPDHPSTLISINNMGVLLRAQGRLSDAEPYSREALEGFRRVFGDNHPNTLLLINNMGALLRYQGRHAEAVALLAPAEGKVREAFTGANALGLAALLTSLGAARAGLAQDAGEFSAAEAILLEAHAIYINARGEMHKETHECVEAIAALYTSWHEAEPDAGHDAKAAEWRSRMSPAETGLDDTAAESDTNHGDS